MSGKSQHSAGYAKRYRLDQARGIPRTMPVHPVRRHIQSLIDQGLSYEGIARAAGCNRQTLRWIVTRSQSYVNAHLGRRILAVAPGQVYAQPQTVVRAVGAQRRLQALQTLGWSHDHLTARCGFLTRGLTGQRFTTGHTHSVIAALYEELCMTPGPSRKAAEMARARGYPGPLCWDDETIDDPDAKPDWGEPGPSREWVTRWENYHDLIALGESPVMAAERVGMRPEAVERRELRDRARREGAA